MIDEAENQPKSSISLSPKRMHRDDQQTIPRLAIAIGHGEIPSTTSCQQEIIHEHIGVNQGNPLSRAELWLRATPNASDMTTA